MMRHNHPSMPLSLNSRGSEALVLFMPNNRHLRVILCNFSCAIRRPIVNDKNLVRLAELTQHTLYARGDIFFAIITRDIQGDF